MKGRIVYTVTIAGTPAMPPATGTLADGDTQTIDLAWHYSKFVPQHKDTRSMSKSASGLAEVRRFTTEQSFRLEVRDVLESTGHAAVLDALNDEIAMGALLIWYPDFLNYPDEYFSCVGNKRLDPSRVGTQYKWNYPFDLKVLSSVQAVSTVPDFVRS